ncbi:MAG TPA: hypothetical protein VD948_12040 [Rhodothermales bacterium]|nr:hypothetical protein [Rhodothermales bacterium]
MLVVLGALPADAQQPTSDLVGRYRAAFLQREVARFEERFGARRPIAPLMRPALQDSALEAALRALDFEELPLIIEPLPELFVLGSVRRFSRLERLAFRAQFPDVAWSYLGSNYRTPLDTALTWRLRGALEARYGMPTQTVVETDETLRQGTTSQFEYWLAVNDTIPLVVTDPNGPRGRGLILATDARFRDLLPSIRDAVFGSLASEAPASYADYFYDAEAREWYLTGFDHLGFVLRAIPRPEFRTSGRPTLEALRREEPRRGRTGRP